MKDIAELKYWVSFTSVAGIGRVRIHQLLHHFGTMEAAWKAPVPELRQAGLDTKVAEAVEQSRAAIEPDEEMDKLEKFQVRAVTCEDESYPARLKEIYDYPPVLYVRGKEWDPEAVMVAIVGTRRATVYGRQVTEEITADLVAAGITVASGLARGVDTVAHRTAVDSGGRTIAVFGCGLDTVYPAENSKLAQAVMEHGALVSEYPIGTRPKAENFPRRNRIMSGLSLGVVVVEAGESSGALITAQQALEQNREVFAVPGSILSPASLGTNMLIQKAGAKLVLTAGDILDELNLSAMAQQLQMKEFAAADETETAILKQMTAEPLNIDEICRRSGLPAATVLSTLTVLELKGTVRQFGTMNFALGRDIRQIVEMQR